jgi:23S rRNA pseudouridine2605 synthase
MKIRLQKILAKAGYGSRRSCEELIRNGIVQINGSIAELGMSADPQVDEILVNGKKLLPPEPLTYLILHKPIGVLSTVSSPDSRATVRSIINNEGRLFPVGRLDVNSEGLVLMTNDGKLTNHLTHPRYEHEKEYRVLVDGHPSKQQLNGWRKGLILEDGTLTRPANVWIEHKDANRTWLGVILKEGKKRQIRRMAEVSGLKIQRLIRIRIANLKLGELLPGEWRELNKQELDDLLTIVEKRNNYGQE